VTEVKPVSPEVACTVCGEGVILVAPDGHGGRIYGYNCTAEVRLMPGLEPRVIKRCPDINHVGRAEPVLGNDSVARERKARTRKDVVNLPAPQGHAYLASFLLQPATDGNMGVLRVCVDGSLCIEVDGCDFKLPARATNSLQQVLNTRKALMR